MARKGRRIAIIGGGPSNQLAPYRDPSWTIWGIAWRIPPRCDALFDIHSPEFKPADHYNNQANQRYRDNVEASGCPVHVLPDNLGLFSRAKAYPLERALGLAGGYLECSIAYMLAAAILKAPEEIGLWGVDLHSTGSYELQRPNIEHLLGIAKGRGIRISVAPGGYLLTSMWEDGRYGVAYRPRPVFVR